MTAKTQSHRPGQEDKGKLQALLDQETSLLNELHDCLEQEQQALLASEVDALFALAVRKEAILKQLVAARQARLHFLKELTTKAPTEGGVPGLSRLVERQRRLVTALMAQIARLNTQNRLFIQDALDVIDEFVDIVSGAKTAPAFYQSKGLISKEKISSRFNCQV